MNWRRAALYATIIGVEGCWLYAIVVLLNDRAGDKLFMPLALLLTLPVAFLFNLLLKRLGWHKFFRDLINIPVWLIALLLTVKLQVMPGAAWWDTAWMLALPRAFGNIFYAFAPEFVVLIVSGAGWWLGRRLAFAGLSFATAIGEFQFGLIMLLLMFFVTHEFNIPQPHAILTALAYFTFALLGISIAHAEEGKGWLVSLRTGWSGLLFASIGVILLLGLLISLLLTPDFVKYIIHLLTLVWNAVFTVLMKIFEFILSLFPPMDPGEMPEPSAPPQTDELGGFEPQQLFPEWLRNSIRLGWSILMIGVLVFTMWRVASQIFSWLRRAKTRKEDAEYESLRGALKADLLNFFKRLLSRLFGIRWAKKQKTVEAPEISTIRQVYRELLKWAQGQGYPRLAFQTPYEYLYTLEGALPGSGEHLRAITEHYVKARYGFTDLHGEELEQLKESLNQVKQAKRKDRENTKS